MSKSPAMMILCFSLRFCWPRLLDDLPVCIFLLGLASFSTNAASSFGNESDRLALLTLKNFLVDGGPTRALSSWNDSVHFCQWHGVTCSRRHHQRVTGLRLDGQSLAGSLPPSIGNLSFLRELNFSNNNLHGTIPKEIGRLSRLQYLSLSNNSLGGEIPIQLTNCSNLKNISLVHNQLIGEIPHQIGFLSQVIDLWLGYNNLIGDIPSSLGNLSSLKILSVRRNNLEGSIPHHFGQLKGLEYIELTENKLSGTIPSSLYNLSSLIEIRLIDNHLSGNLMPNIGFSFPNLRKLGMGMNQFTGTIPVTLSNISGLELFDIAVNILSGQVPNNLGVLHGLQWFNIGFNRLGSGKDGDLNFLSSLTNLTGLKILGLGSNHFGGVLPNSIVNLSAQLTFLSLAENEIHGSIPEGIGNFVNLTIFAIGGNYLAGVIPNSIGKLQKVGQLGLNQNRLSGSIPSSLGNLTQLYFLTLDANNLEGSIPLSLGNCKYMQTLSIAGNKLSGNIPNPFISLFVQLISLHLFQNALTGSLPPDVGNLKNLGEIQIFDNNLSGEIPKELGNCLGLEYLHMAGNLFEGNIPLSLSSLKGLRFLDLSRNNLSGMIPKELQSLAGLQSLNLSSNHLEGEVPTGGVFRNFSAISVAGNKKLCGGIPQLQLPACSNLESGNHKKALSVKVIIVITISGVVLLSFIVAIVIIYLGKRPKRKSSSSSPSPLGYGLLRVSYKELYEATDGFASSNLIGMGSFGSVYKGILNQYKSLVAVKVLNLQQHGAFKSFMAECRALSGIRHRNLLKIITCCSSVDFRGNAFLALVFEFMPNGSLENWLHVNGRHEARNLNLDKRLDIAIDVALALDYLHHRCETVIVHCDLKPSNVLLDDDLIAHVSDFGLAKLLSEVTGNFGEGQTSSVAIKGTVGYVAPEYGMGGEVSTQGDVYSYGILLLEMITGKRPTDDMFKDGLSLHSFCKTAFPERVEELVDSCLLVEEIDEATRSRAGNQTRLRGKRVECLVSIVQIGISCSAELPGERMDIQDVIAKLHQVKEVFLGVRGHGEAVFSAAGN